MTGRPDETQIRAQLAVIIPKDANGYLHVALGTDPYIDSATGKYRHHNWAEKSFVWPASRDTAVKVISAAAAVGDPYVCTILMQGRKRSPDEATARKLLHADHDGGQISHHLAEVKRLNCFAYGSGSVGNGHVYAHLTHQVTPAQYEVLAKGLIAHFDGDKGKWAENDVLRVAGTFSFKPTVDVNGPTGNPPTPVAELVPFTAEVDPFWLAAELGVDISNTTAVACSRAKTVAAPKGSRPQTESIDWTAYPEVRKALDKNTGDRSHDSHRIVGVCIDHGLTLPQTRWVIDQRLDLAARITQMFARSTPVDDVLNSWNTIQANWRVGPMSTPTPVATQISNTPSTGAPLPDGFGDTQTGDAARLIQLAGHKLRYVHAWGKWLVYTDGRWILDEKDALITELAKGVSSGLFELAADCVATHGKKEAKRAWLWAMRSCTASGIAAMIKLARGVPDIIVNHEQLDADPWLLNVTNGTVDLRTGALRPHDPNDLCYMQCPVDYDPSAFAPLWDKCLQTWQPDGEMLEYLQVRAGAGATGIPTETVDIDYGQGGNGKSKFHGAIQYVLGPYATVPHKSLLVAGRHEQHPTVYAKLFRKRLAVASETSAAEALNEEQVKNLTGGDRIEGRRMREDPWEFWPSHTLIMFSNHKPSIRGQDEGIWRRTRMVEWLVTIAAKDRDEMLATKLQAEAQGILRWIVEGAEQFHREGLNPPDAVLVATEDYRKSEDVIGRFCDEELGFDPTMKLHCQSADIKTALDAWCEEQSIEAPRMNDVAAILRQRGAIDAGRKKINGVRSTLWNGVAPT